MAQVIKIEIDDASYKDVKQKMLGLYQLADEISKKINFAVPQIYKPDGIFIATEADGSQWVMLEDFITAQKSIQRFVYGTGWLARISNFIIGLGWLVAGIAASKGQKGNIP